MGKRNRLRRQSIRELPLMVGPLPLPDARLFDDEAAGPANGSAGATPESNESLPIVPRGTEEGVEDGVLTPADGEPLRP